jgi:hypothetical protein
MQMIYALEWYDIPRSAYSDLIEFHPYLTESDYDKLFYVNTQNRIENGVSMLLYTLVSNRLLMTRGPNIFRVRRFARIPGALLAGGLFTWITNRVLLKPIYLNDLDDMGLTKKYFELDLNADMMREDLSKLGIKIDARHFNMEEAQAKVNK